jgi:hypothetical protein
MITTQLTEAVAWFATGLTLSSFGFRKQTPFRILNTAGAIVWVVWGTLTDTTPVVFTNLAILGLNTIWFVRSR